MDLIYEYSDDDHRDGFDSVLTRIQIGFHTLFCSNCNVEIERYKETRNIMRKDFFPTSPGFEDSIMAKLQFEQTVIGEKAENPYAIPGGISTRGWVIAGLVILVSLVTAFFGLDFNKVAREAGISFLLPVGITIGIVLTSYGALFIGSHLKELSERFGL
jgi:hypothetical protein